MILRRRRPDDTPPLETVGTVVIIYNQGRNGPNNIAAIRQADFGRLVNVINAYQGITSVRGQLRTHPNEQVRHQTREMLGLPQPKPEPLPTRPFELQTYTVKPGKRRRHATLVLGPTVTLSPWLMRSAQLTETRNVLAPVEK